MAIKRSIGAAAIYAKAAPTKAFFISVLVRDLKIKDAIIELVDNAIDASRTLTKAAFQKIVVEVSFGSRNFCIKDNSAGISIETARDYAFRFGRASGAPKTPGSVGEFGVGMKRALFKLGRHFIVESRTKEDWFKITVDVDAWEKLNEEDPKAWSFKFDFAKRNPTPTETGTTITVTKLYSYALEDFATGNFGSRLSLDLKEKHAQALASGLQIEVNGSGIIAEHATLQAAAGLAPIFHEKTLTVDGKKVQVRLLAGVGEPKLTDAGWYIIERADKTQKTGWDSELEGSKTPRPHWQFRRFRGFVFFDSKASDVLPWNTTKTSLDVEAPAYRRVLNDMTTALHEVIEFLNAVDEEGADGPLETMIKDARAVQLEQVEPNRNFRWSKSGAAPKDKQAVISYRRPATLVGEVRERLGATTNREVGEKTFEFYVESEGLDG